MDESPGREERFPEGKIALCDRPEVDVEALKDGMNQSVTCDGVRSNLFKRTSLIATLVVFKNMPNRHLCDEGILTALYLFSLYTFWYPLKKTKSRI